MQILVSLHDVTPAHQPRLDHAERLLAEAGVRRVAYLLVPDHHRQHPIANNHTFAAWCARPRPFRVDWVLHGYTHLDEGQATPLHRNPLAWMKRALLTGGEGEFLTLSAADQRARLTWGRAAAESIGIHATSFVAPAWLYNDALRPALAATGFRYTEDHWQVIDIASNTARTCPVITWATRTPLRRRGSLVVCPLLLKRWRHAPLLRIALHPHDFDYADTVQSITRVLSAALAHRACVGYDDIFN